MPRPSSPSGQPIPFAAYNPFVARRTSAGINDDSLALLRRWTSLLDSAFQVPGTRIRFGWDPILGLVPGLGDLVTPLFAAVLLAHALTLGVPKIVQLRMVLNVLFDLLAGTIPLVGDAFDVAWKANARNLTLLERHAGGQVRPTVSDWAFVGATILVLAAIAILPLALFGWLISRVIGP